MTQGSAHSGRVGQNLTDPAGILLDRIAQVIFLCGAEISMPHQLLDQVRWHPRSFQPDSKGASQVMGTGVFDPPARPWISFIHDHTGSLADPADDASNTSRC